MLIVEALLLSYGPLAHLGDSDYDLNRVIIRAAYLAIFAFLIGLSCRTGEAAAGTGIDLGTDQQQGTS